MVTNSVKRFKEADHLLFLEKGRLANQGTFRHLDQTDQAFRQFLAFRLERSKDAVRGSEVARLLTSPSSEARQLSGRVDTENDSGVDHEAQSTDKGVFSALLTYVQAGSYKLTILAIILGLLTWPLFQASRISL